MVVYSSLLFEALVDNITMTAFIYRRIIAKIRNFVSLHNVEKFIHAVVTLRLDYCNDSLSGYSSRCVQAAVRQQEFLLEQDMSLLPPLSSTLHWLPIKSLH